MATHEPIPEELRDKSSEGVAITIVGVDAAAAPHLPSHLFPGCGSDGAKFEITSGQHPHRDDLSEMLYESIVDGCLVEYDQGTGKGYFRIIDGDAPAVGRVIPLVNPFCDPDAIPLECEDED